MLERQKFSIFVTGTDTGVGKTLVSAALLHALARHYPRVVGMKPVAAGTALVDGVQANDPVLLADPLSPHIAAARAGVTISIPHLVACHRQLLARADAVLVEGAGGFMVPLSATETGADLAQALDLPVVLVVGLRLGCLNHALLSAWAIRARGLTLAGWVANHVDPTMLAQADNIAFLQDRLQAPLLASIPHQAQPDARQLNLEIPLAWQATPPRATL
jgi:dethiobiotin synthetase